MSNYVVKNCRKSVAPIYNDVYKNTSYQYKYLYGNGWMDPETHESPDNDTQYLVNYYRSSANHLDKLSSHPLHKDKQGIYKPKPSGRYVVYDPELDMFREHMQRQQAEYKDSFITLLQNRVQPDGIKAELTKYVERLNRELPDDLPMRDTIIQKMVESFLTKRFEDQPTISNTTNLRRLVNMVQQGVSQRLSGAVEDELVSDLIDERISEETPAVTGRRRAEAEAEAKQAREMEQKAKKTRSKVFGVSNDGEPLPGDDDYDEYMRVVNDIMSAEPVGRGSNDKKMRMVEYVREMTRNIPELAVQKPTRVLNNAESSLDERFASATLLIKNNKRMLRNMGVINTANVEMTVPALRGYLALSQVRDKDQRVRIADDLKETRKRGSYKSKPVSQRGEDEDDFDSPYGGVQAQDAEDESFVKVKKPKKQPPKQKKGKGKRVEA